MMFIFAVRKGSIILLLQVAHFHIKFLLTVGPLIIYVLAIEIVFSIEYCFIYLVKSPGKPGKQLEFDLKYLVATLYYVTTLL